MGLKHSPENAVWNASCLWFSCQKGWPKWPSHSSATGETAYCMTCTCKHFHFLKENASLRHTNRQVSDCSRTWSEEIPIPLSPVLIRYAGRNGTNQTSFRQISSITSALLQSASFSKQLITPLLILDYPLYLSHVLYVWSPQRDFKCPCTKKGTNCLFKTHVILKAAAE